MKIIPKNTFLEMDKDVKVKVLYPCTQIDIFNYHQPGSKIIHRKGVLVSTTYKNQIYYEYSVFEELNNELIELRIIDLKNKLKKSVMNHLDGYVEQELPDMNCNCKKDNNSSCNSGSCNC